MTIITAAMLASHVGVDDAEDDATLNRAVAAVNEAVVRWCGFPMRRFDKTATDDASARFYRPDDQCRLYVTDFWETTELIVQIDSADSGSYATTWTEGVEFAAGPVNAADDGEPYTYLDVVSGYLPTYNRRPAVKVTAAWGWADMPGAVIEGALIKAAKVWKRKDSIEGVLGGFADFNAVRISSREDPDVCSLLQPFKRNERAARIA